jgi:prepilin-type N-terminal cleavage/methylation domain-containing protein
MRVELSVVSCQLSVAATSYRCQQQTTDYGPRTQPTVAASLRDANSSLGETRLRYGLTLIELLVVIIILTTIVAAAIPIMAPADNDRRMREASRSLNTVITVAQSRAISLNRPVGIALKRLSQDTSTPTNPRLEDRGVCVQVYFIEQLPPFSGFDENSRARLAFYPTDQTNEVLIQFVTRGNSAPINNDGLPTGWDADQFPPGMIRPGDVIEINGTQYRLNELNPSAPTELDSNGFYTANTGRNTAIKAAQIRAVAVNGTGQMMNMTHDDLGFEIATGAGKEPPFFTLPAPYKIFRQAMPTSDEPFQMPEGTAIDLRASGLGYFDYFYWPGAHDNNDPVMILFTPEGKVSRLRYNQGWVEGSEPVKIFDAPVVDDLYLLVGAREKAVLPDASADPTLDPAKVALANTDEKRQKLREPLNWLQGSSRWIVIGSQSGRIATVGNAFVDLPTVAAMTLADPELKRAQQIMAARELTHLTTQATGR